MKDISPVPSQNFNLPKAILATYVARKDFVRDICGATKPLFALKDSNSASRFFRTRGIPPPLQNACDFVLEIYFVKEHILGKKNTAALLLSRLEANPHERNKHETRQVISTKSIEVNEESAGISPEEPLLNTNENQFETPEQDTWQQNVEIRNTTPGQARVITFASYFLIEIPKESSTMDKTHFSKPSRKLIEQNSDFYFSEIQTNNDGTITLWASSYKCSEIYALLPKKKTHHPQRWHTILKVLYWSRRNQCPAAFTASSASCHTF